MKPKQWTSEEIEDMKNSPLTASFQLAYRYNRTERSVRSKRYRLGLKEPYIHRLKQKAHEHAQLP